MTSLPMNEEHVITESRLISLNSKFASEYLNGDKNSSVSFDFNGIARKDARVLYHSIAIQSAEIPASYYIVNTTNNVINITEGILTTNVTIPVGNYNADTFATAFIAQYDILFPAAPNFAFDPITGKFGLVSGTVNSNITINLATTTAQVILGIDPKAVGTVVFTGNATNTRTPFPRLANFLGITEIKICSNALAGDNYDSVSLNTSTLVDTVSTTATAFGLTIYNSLGRESFIKAKRIDEIDIQLLDQDDKVIDFNGIHWNFTFIFNTHRRKFFSNDDGIINFEKMEKFEEAKVKPEPLKEEIQTLQLENVKEEIEPEPEFDDFDDDVLLN
jgi:hypothetical protein|tara:strand:+ start:464 stop:1459 length:996 start_codon:yes stop_codon:yes gene_type:complete